MLERIKNLFQGRGEPRHIFVISAMRSGSTLMQHVIAQPPCVLSAGETKIEYTGPEKLEALRKHLFTYENISEGDRNSRPWVYLEKCVHDRYLPAIPPIENPQMRFVFILRHPHPALTSLMKLKGWPYTESVESAHWYYTHRFASIIKLAEGIGEPENAYFLSYEDFLENPEPHLAALTRFLGFKEPLKSVYPEQKWTAKLSLGDVSENIRSRKIVSYEKKPLIDMPDELKASLEETYRTAQSELAILCKGQAQYLRTDG